MSAPFWTEEEQVVFLNYILPKSQYANGSFDRNSGMGWKGLAPLMQAEMARLGHDSQRDYTGSLLSHLHYKCFSARSLTRSEGAGLMAPLREQPGSLQRPFPRQVPAPTRVRLPRGYVSHFTQTDPNEFAGLSADEALSVHANTDGQTNHDLSADAGRPKRSERKMAQPERDIVGSHRGDAPARRARKRRHEEDLEKDTGTMDTEEYQEYQASQREVEEDLQHPGKKFKSIHPDSVDDLPAFGTSDILTQKPRSTSGSILDDDASIDGPDYSIATSPPKSAKAVTETKAEQRARLFDEHQLRFDNEEREKRRVFKKLEAQWRGPYAALETLDESGDSDIEMVSQGSSRPRPDPIEASEGYDEVSVKKPRKQTFGGRFVDGIYQPVRGGLFAVSAHEENQISPNLDIEPSSPSRQRISSPTPAHWKKVPAGTTKNKATRGSENAAAKQKNVPTSPKTHAIKKFKVVPSKMTNKLPQVTSKHPIGYTDREIPFFESIKLPRIPKKSGSAKPIHGKGPAGKDHSGKHEERHRDNLRRSIAVGNSEQGDLAKKPVVDIADRVRQEKTVNIAGEVYKVSALPPAVKRTLNIDDDGNVRTARTSISATTPTETSAPKMSITKATITTTSMTAKKVSENDVLKSLKEDAHKEPNPDDAPAWAKVIAAGRGYGDAAHTPATATEEEAQGLEKQADGLEKVELASPKKQ